MFFLFSVFGSDNNADLAEKVRRAADDEREFAALSRDFEKHLRVLASQVTGRFITESDDEWSVALLAFYEAVRSYEPSRGSFTAFSDMVVKRRLIDHVRAQARTSREQATDMSFEAGRDDEEGRYEPAARKMTEESEAALQREEESRDIRSEIEALNTELKRYGISFSDLPAVSPKAEKTRRACAKAALYVWGSDIDYRDMKRSGKLPAASITKKCGIPRKLLDNHRKYIIAVIEIMRGDYPRLGEFTRELRNLSD